ncbi:hypothetical protein SULAR_08065 [Sulfurovum sp. AR]|nr:hypothetical protein SULAR_08065 [Sulfurovum sp. AR]
MLIILLGSVFVYIFYLKEKKNSWMPSNVVFVQNVIIKALNLPTKDQVDVLGQNYSHLNVWSVDIPTALP